MYDVPPAAHGVRGFRARWGTALGFGHPPAGLGVLIARSIASSQEPSIFRRWGLGPLGCLVFVGFLAMAGFYQFGGTASVCAASITALVGRERGFHSGFNARISCSAASATNGASPGNCWPMSISKMYRYSTNASAAFFSTTSMGSLSGGFLPAFFSAAIVVASTSA